MSNKYATIKTTAELDKAIKEVHARREKVSKGFEKDVSRLRNRYRPANLMLGAVRRYSPYFSWAELGLGLVRGLKKRLK